MKNELTIDVKFSLSLWQCIKLRIAGRHYSKRYCELLLEALEAAFPALVDEQKKNNVAPGVN